MKYKALLTVEVEIEAKSLDEANGVAQTWMGNLSETAGYADQPSTISVKSVTKDDSDYLKACDERWEHILGSE